MGGIGAYRFGFNGKEKDTDGEWGKLTHYDYGARWYDASIGRFTSVDPLASDYAFQSPYAYATNNPVLLRDIMGMGVEDIIITGDAADKAFSLLQASSSNLSMSMDKKSGKVSIEKKNNSLTPAEVTLLNASLDKTVNVNIEATSNNIAEDGDAIFNGAFMGNKKVGGRTETTQLVNPVQMEKTESIIKQEKGVTMMHETLESYLAAKISPNGTSATNTKVYIQAHNAANRLDLRRANKIYNHEAKVININRKKGTFDLQMNIMYNGKAKPLYFESGLAIPKKHR